MVCVAPGVCRGDNTIWPLPSSDQNDRDPPRIACQCRLARPQDVGPFRRDHRRVGAVARLHDAPVSHFGIIDREAPLIAVSIIWIAFENMLDDARLWHGLP
jgi:hypothetical protein